MFVMSFRSAVPICRSGDAGQICYDRWYVHDVCICIWGLSNSAQELSNRDLQHISQSGSVHRTISVQAEWVKSALVNILAALYKEHRVTL